MQNDTAVPTYRAPGPSRITRGTTSEKLYRLEEQLHELIRKTANERAKFIGVTVVSGSTDYYHVTLPQVLFDLFDSYDKGAVREAITAYVRHNPEQFPDLRVEP
jgi:hypothetical protein